TSTLIQLKGQLSPQEAKQIIEGLQKGTSGAQGGGARGPRSDANWTNHRRYEERQGGVIPTSIQGFFAQVICTSAIAQSAAQPARKPVVQSIRPRTTTTQPARSNAAP